MIILISITALIFLILGIIHMYWALGGKWGLIGVLPTKPDGDLWFSPKPKSTLIIAIGLILFAVIITGNIGIFDSLIHRKYIHYASLVIAFIFFLRAIGDFKYVGITKRIRNTRFAANDNQIFIPLCIALATFSSLIAVFS